MLLSLPKLALAKSRILSSGVWNLEQEKHNLAVWLDCADGVASHTLDTFMWGSVRYHRAFSAAASLP